MKKVTTNALVVELKARFGNDLFAANLRDSDIADVYATLAPETKAARNWMKFRDIPRGPVSAVSLLISSGKA